MNAFAPSRICDKFATWQYVTSLPRGTCSSSHTSLKDYYRWHARIYDLTRWAFLFGRARIIHLAASQMDQPISILEIGCGTGRNLAALAQHFPQAQITGLDLSSDMLERARSKVQEFGPRVVLLHRAYDAPVATAAKFDLIVLSYSLSMINPGFAEVLRICKTDLSPTGIVAVVAGARRLAHTDWLRADKALHTLLGIARFPGTDTVRNLFARFRQCHIEEFWRPLWKWLLTLSWPVPAQGFSLDLDSTVFQRSGQQEGAKRGYNPSRPGRHSHYPLLAFLAEAPLVLHAWLRSGNTGSARGVTAFLTEAFALMPAAWKLPKVGVVSISTNPCWTMF
jgi:S-adenosylmethionine-diacylgycerolhomoserine-N-methlytransferase